MFLRAETRTGSSKQPVQLVESVREGQKVGQRIVRHVGVAKSEAELEKLMELGETVKVGIRCERQPSLLTQEKLVDPAIKTRREKAKKDPPVVIEETCEEHRVVTGFHEACGAVHRQLGFEELLPGNRSRTARETLRHIAAARIANPESKRGTARQCSIVRDTRSKRRYALPSKTTPDMDRICRTLGLPMSRTPYWIE